MKTRAIIGRGSGLSLGLALALPLLLAALASVTIVQPVIEAYQEREEAISARRELLAQYQRIAAQGPLYDRALAALQDDPWMRSAFFSGENATIVAAALQQQAKSIIQESGGALQSAQILPDSANEDIRRIGVRVKVVSDIDALRRFLVRIHENTPLLLVEQLEIASKPSRRNRAAPAEQMLESQFTIVGFVRGS